MPDTSPEAISPGRWVLCWGQILDEPAHPDDAVVEFFSHNEQYHCHIRLDRIEAADLPDFAEVCFSLHAFDNEPLVLERCGEPLNHAGPHRGRESEWDEADTTGFFEGA